MFPSFTTFSFLLRLKIMLFDRNDWRHKKVHLLQTRHSTDRLCSKSQNTTVHPPPPVENNTPIWCFSLCFRHIKARKRGGKTKMKEYIWNGKECVSKQRRLKIPNRPEWEKGKYNLQKRLDNTCQERRINLTRSILFTNSFSLSKCSKFFKFQNDMIASPLRNDGKV